MLVCLLHASPESVMAKLEVNIYKSVQKGKLAAQNVINVMKMLGIQIVYPSVIIDLILLEQ